ncbi:response regulator [Glycomyces artemisiae]|uniref:LuxR family two component transcriptional regulator n=1 Tax=Glycomyces artemisiae TaxID=1076443 RepID=A0A2T0UAM3_9ACTN|nr:response regulator transcription factor [Glycomyces artemisiae]PRY54918.1 LuxR family two component transcriptional regulator [Glycomyces artemisiae]
MIRVLVADDQEPVRTGLRLLLQSLPDVDVVGEAADGVEAVRLAQALRPDVALLDIRMPGLNGIEATSLLAGERIAEPIAVVVITTFDLDEYVHGALRAGAKGFLLKESGPQLIGEAVRAAANGDALISPQVTARLLGEFSRPAKQVRQPSPPLTAREEEVLALLATGLTNTEIGERLYLSLGTVKTHIAGVLAKLGVRNRVEAAMWAYETGRVP